MWEKWRMNTFSHWKKKYKAAGKTSQLTLSYVDKLERFVVSCSVETSKF